MNHRQRSIAALGFVVLFLAGTAAAQDWPQWRGPNRDGKATGFKAPAKWPGTLPLKWKTTVGTGDATPALVGDKLYVFARQGDDEVLSCLSAADGKEAWKKSYPAQKVGGAASSHPGPRSSPTVSGDKVVTFGVGGVLSCFDAASGKEVWRKEEPKAWPTFFTSSSPIVVDGVCIAQVGGPGNGAVVAYELADGKEKWKTPGEGPAYSSPVLMTADGAKAIVTFTEKSLVALSTADGKLLWQVPAQPERRTYNAATPIVDGQTVIYSGQGSGTRAVKVEKAGDKLEEKEVWSNKEQGTGFDSPVLHDGLLFGLSDKGILFCLNAKDGKTAWADSAKHDNFGSVVDAGSVILALTGKEAELIAFKPSGEKYEELAKIKVADSPTYAHPVVSGNRIFIKDKDSVALYTVE